MASNRPGMRRMIMIVLYSIASAGMLRHAVAAGITTGSFTKVTTLISGKNLHRPSGVAIDPVSGDVYIADHCCPKRPETWERAARE